MILIVNLVSYHRLHLIQYLFHLSTLIYPIINLSHNFWIYHL